MTRKKILVTGGLGFIGVNFINRALQENYEIFNLDLCTYASNPSEAITKKNDSQYHFQKGDIADEKMVEKIIYDFKPNYLIHFAAESHVDNSIKVPENFINTNIIGTFNILNTLLKYIRDRTNNDFKRLLHVSTDEVYGSLASRGKFSELAQYAPNSPYSASKASSDLLVRSYIQTYGLPALITNCSNNFGPYQHHEKLIPKIIKCAIDGTKIPIYGNGKNIRDWLHVSQHVETLLHLLTSNMKHQKYNIGGGTELTNIELTYRIIAQLEHSTVVKKHSVQIDYVEDRLGHDYRYAIDDARLRDELPRSIYQRSFAEDLTSTIQWYVDRWS